MNTAEFDQMMAAFRDIAISFKSAYDSYIKAGFDPQQALYLTAQLQHSILAGGERK